MLIQFPLGYRNSPDTVFYQPVIIHSNDVYLPDNGKITTVALLVKVSEISAAGKAEAKLSTDVGAAENPGGIYLGDKFYYK